MHESFCKVNLNYPCVIPNITFANLCKPIINVKIIPVSSDPLNLESIERGKILVNKKKFFNIRAF